MIIKQTRKVVEVLFLALRFRFKTCASALWFYTDELHVFCNQMSKEIVQHKIKRKFLLEIISCVGLFYYGIDIAKNVNFQASMETASC